MTDPSSVPPVDRPDDEEPFSRPRAWGGLGLLALVALAFILDATPAFDFEIDSIQLGLLLGSALLLLGVEAGKKLIR